MWAHDFIRIIYRASAPAGSGSPEPPQVDQKKRVVALLLALLHLLGALTSVQAVMETRTSQGAIAWAISLNTFPYAALPTSFLCTSRAGLL